MPEVPPKKQKVAPNGSFVTPLRYPGGKGRLGPWLSQVMRHNRISGGTYVEPYAGGAGAALFLLMRGYVNDIVINDADPIVFSFWKAATKNNKELVKKIKTTPINMDTWYQQKKIIESPGAFDLVEVAFATFFLNRTNRSGILSAGVIGGKAQAGTWRLDARYNVGDLGARVEKIGEMSKHITVYGSDALEILQNVVPEIGKKCLVYLDPPYYVKGSLLYRNHYKPEDHSEIAACVVKAEYPLLVTYDDCAEIRALYREIESVNFSLHYSTHTARPKASEILFYKNIELPFDPALTRRNQLCQQALTKGEMLSQKEFTI
ncbi:DNA adenine methylase [Delftia tsuruhatensis]|uniref:DNA adenine methylase n=1 Tax=Delftia tsuruhatensis TaxID=180282 RepID=UPI0028AC1E33|nr:DNA adenine methylase [Delftia tsuruhatensis]